MRPDYGVVVPCYNDGHTLTETMQSLENQGAAEIVVVDDGSTDPQTLKILDELTAAGCYVIRQENQGLSAARMTGVRHTTASLIVAIDSDDLVPEGALSALASAFEEDPGISVAFGDIELFGVYTGMVRCSWGWDPWVITYANLVPGACSMIRRDHLIADGGWVLKGGYEDWDLWMSMLENRRRATYVPRSVLLYRQRKGRMLSSSNEIHNSLYQQARSRHAALFARRWHSWRHSRAPLRVRTVGAVVEILPKISDETKNRMVLFAAKPHRALTARVQRLKRRLR